MCLSAALPGCTRCGVRFLTLQGAGTGRRGAESPPPVAFPRLLKIWLCPWPGRSSEGSVPPFLLKQERRLRFGPPAAVCRVHEKCRVQAKSFWFLPYEKRAGKGRKKPFCLPCPMPGGEAGAGAIYSPFSGKEQAASALRCVLQNGN